MKWNRRGTRLATTVLVMVVSVAMLTLAMGATASASARGTTAFSPALVSTGSHHTIVVYPNGVDDTADIQAAFNTCVSYGPGCTVQLVKGTYYTDQVTVYGFQGLFVGAGEGQTLIQAFSPLPSNPAHNSPTASYWQAPPGSSNPWPALFTFAGGSYQVSGMTLSEPYFQPSVGFYDSGVAFDALPGVFLVTGAQVTDQANAHFDNVKVVGAAGDFAGYNLQNAIFFAGLILAPGGTTAADLLPLTGSFSVTNSEFIFSDSGPWFWNLLHAELTVCYNTAVTAGAPYGLFDTYGSVATFCGNSASDVENGAGILVWQGYSVISQVPTTVYIVGNDFQVSDESNGALLIDSTDSLSAVVSGNVIQTDTSCGCYLSDEPDAWTDSAVSAVGLASTVVSGNTIVGGGAAGVYVSGSIVFGGSTYGGPATVRANTIMGTVVGVWVDYANYVLVSGNVITNSAEWGIAVTDGSSYNLIAHNIVLNSVAYDLYWDLTGTGNVWTHNVCSTSSPPGLC